MPTLAIAIEVTALVVAGTMVGNEFAVAAFIHPNPSRQNDQTHAHSAQALARTFGRIMPPWYAASLLLNIAVVLLVRTSWIVSWWLACVSAALSLSLSCIRCSDWYKSTTASVPGISKPYPPIGGSNGGSGIACIDSG
ncbi:MAG TPA: hypothetical protein VKZ59_14605 [Acidobacteriota bacterium]|nr:hypothetical protein [Acidobacteriota bacterium]